MLMVLERPAGLDLFSVLAQILHALTVFSYHKDIISTKIKKRSIFAKYMGAFAIGSL